MDSSAVVSGNSRMELQRKIQRLASIVVEWCEYQKLKVSVPKSGLILLKGKIQTTRPLIVKMYGQSLKGLREKKFLGVTFQKRLKVGSHIEALTSKCLLQFGKISRSSRANWGYNCKSFKTLYECVFKPTVLYAAASWWDLVDAASRRKLVTLQRRVLLWLTRAYRTVSHEALHMIAGVLPIDLEMEARVAQYRIRKGMSRWSIRPDDLRSSRVT